MSHIKGETAMQNPNFLTTGLFACGNDCACSRRTVETRNGRFSLPYCLISAFGFSHIGL